MSPADEAFFFGTGAGQLGLSILRVGLTNGHYDPGDCSSVSSSCAGAYLADMKAIIASGGRVYASAYSPPATMTTNGSTICQAGAGNGALATGSYGAFATWITNFVQSVSSNGANIYALSIQNEPEVCQTYDSALWTAAQMDTFIKTNLGPTLAGAGLTPYVFMPETDVYSDLNGYGGTCMTDSSCYNYVGGNNWHDYDATFPTFNSTPNPWASLNKKYWQTEGSCLFQSFCTYSPYDGSITDALSWAGLIYDRLANENANAWLFLDLENFFNNGTNIGLTQNASTAVVAQRAYAIAQYSKFVRPGWIRVDATPNPLSGVYVTAFKNPGGTSGAIVVVNTSGSDPGTMTFNVGTFLGSSVTPYLTNGSNSLATQSPVTVSAGSFSYDPGPSSIVTFVGSGGAGGSVTISPSSLAFGNVVQNTTSAGQTATVTNSSGGSITMGTTTFTGANASDFTASANTCTGTLTNTSTCTVTVVLTPTATPVASESGTLNVAFTGFTGSPLTVSLSGTSVNAPAGNKHYVDYVTGNDSNSGNSTSTPWKHAPGMMGLTPSGGSTGDGCTALCASTPIAPGDMIILKGGTVWPYTTAPWTFSSNGSSSTSLYGCTGSGCIYIGSAVGAGLSAWNNGTVTSITLKRDLGGWSPGSPPTISCSGGGGSGAAATPLVVPSANTDANTAEFIYQVNLTNAGSGYTSAPGCVTSGGSGQATLVADINRAIIDWGAQGGSPPDWPNGQCGNFPSTCYSGIHISGSYVILNGIEARNMLMADPNGGSEFPMIGTDGNNHTLTNIYVHGMFLDCVKNTTDCSNINANIFALSPGAPYDEASHNIVTNADATFLASSGQISAGVCQGVNVMCSTVAFGISSCPACNGPTSIHDNTIYEQVWQTRETGSSVNGSVPYLFYNNEVWFTTQSANSGAHLNARYFLVVSPATVVAWNNIFHSQVGGTSSQIQCPTGTSFSFYNEVHWGEGGGTQGYSLDMADVGGTGGCSLTLYNDTIVESRDNQCVNSQPGSNSTTIIMQNLHCVGASTAPNPFWSTGITNSTYQNYAGSTVQANVQASSTVQSISTANGQGYVTTNLFAPTSSGNSTVTFAGTGGAANLTSLCTGYFVPLCSDILGNLRPNSAFQAGAYEFGGSTPTAGTPSCSPGSGTYNTAQSVTCSVSGGAPVLCYTVDGSTPSTNGVSACSHGTLYSGAITVASSLTLKVIAGGSGFLDGSVVTYNYTYTGPAGTPSCTPGSGTYGSTQSVTCSVAGGAPVLCYTVNGATPATNGTSGCTTGTHYTGAISVSSTLTLKVIAGGAGFTDGPVATFNYTITSTAGTPSCTPGSGSYGSAQSVTCTVSSGPVQCYTTTGATPATNGTTGCTTGTLVSGTIPIPASLTLKVRAGGTGFQDGSVATYTYTISGIAGTPTCSPGAGTYTTTQSVTCSVAGGAPVLCYTTDGSTPATNGTTGCTHGTHYTTAISVSVTTTLKVIAGGTGFTDGPIDFLTYTISNNPTSGPFPMFGYLTGGSHTTCPVCGLGNGCICKANDGVWLAINGSTYSKI